MLVFSAITPHPPILIPSIGQDALEQIKKPQQAMEKLAEDFYHSQAETVIVISPHGKLMESAFTLNTEPEFTADFKQFGDMETKMEFKCDTAFAHQIKEAVETKLSVQMITESELDHGAGVPLFYLSKNLADPSASLRTGIKVIPIGYNMQDNQVHFEFGQELAEIIHNSPKRIAVVASGDLSHVLTKNAPAGYSPEGKKFDKKIVELIKNKKIDNILKLNKKSVAEAAECGLKSIIILLGVLSEHNYEPEVLSYEGPFGVGYLVCNFTVS